MTARAPTRDDGQRQAASPGRGPSVTVVASEPLAGELVELLGQDGLELEASNRAPVSGRPDVVVVAIESLSSREDALEQARAKHPAARLVVVAGKASPAEARQLLVDDVPGLVLESDVRTALAASVRAAFAGQISYPAVLMPTELRAALSNREKQILAMVVMGFSNAEIAAKLFVSESTVKSHLHSAFATIGVGSRREAVALILDPNAGFGAGILAITDAGLSDGAPA
jgi:DNA-binding NarL/FixJ family response regulator